jgi:hemolysin III
LRDEDVRPGSEYASPSTHDGRARDVPLGSPTRPSWRGRLHLFGLMAALPTFVLLIVHADGKRATWGAVVYALGLCSMLAVSTIYHRWVHTIRARGIWQRLDHAMIFAAIAGTVTPLSLVALGTRSGVPLIVLFWGAAVIGAALKVSGRRVANGVASGMYIGIGLAGVVLIPALWKLGGVTPVALLAGGGAIYILGAVGFWRGWPVLRPRVFSFHEVWHANTIAAAAAHFAAVWIIAA